MTAHRRTKIVGLTGTVLAASIAFAAPASASGAIHEVSCGSRTDYFKVLYNAGTSTICYANAGVISVVLPRMTKVSTGNNAGNFTTNSACIIFGKNQTLTYPQTTWIYNINIS